MHNLNSVAESVVVAAAAAVVGVTKERSIEVEVV